MTIHREANAIPLLLAALFFTPAQAGAQARGANYAGTGHDNCAYSRSARGSSKRRAVDAEALPDPDPRSAAKSTRRQW